MKSKKLLYILLGAVVVLVLFAIVGRKSGVIGQHKGLKVATEKADMRSVIESVSANGKIQPETEVKISPDVSGEIVSLFVREGQMLKKDDPIAVIKPDVYRSAVERMEASLNTSRANLANSKARLEQVKAAFINTELTHKRNKVLWDKKAISQADFDASVASFESASADVRAAEENVNAAEFTVRSAEAALKEARDNLAKTEIFAPISGTVYGLSIEQGERVVGTTQMAGTEMLRIANLDAMEVNVEVNENDIVRVTLGDTTDIEVDAYLDKTFKGVVTEIANSANTQGLSMDQVTNFQVKIRILPESYKALTKGKEANYSPFRPGMSATVEIRTESANNVLTVPIQCVTTRDSTMLRSKRRVPGDDTPEEGEKEKEDQQKAKEPVHIKSYVFLLQDGKAVMREVETGIQDNTYIQITKGLQEGDEVISAPYNAISRLLKDQDLVEKVSKESLFDNSEK
ncbi:MAG: efflux RND transporter periplasmic adaptor subunit [Flavobacteriales bacterium]|nr:efflux RND transporter periplasmic adaptor subunit [Flavobacteriales bacterium]MCB9449220.1 efflux RND transporter periplasmic adaptor subunit [Flavobacteriales bacterium]